MRNRKSRKQLPEHYHFPSDLWSDVFSRLTPKTLLQLRCVCKSWCSLIDSLDFIDCHLKFNPRNCAKTQLLVEERVPKTRSDTKFTVRRSDTFRKIAQLVLPSKFHMVYKSPTIHGLMLIENSRENELCLWNPSIRKSVLLPPSPLKFDFWNYSCLLGFAPSSNDYKVFVCKLVDAKAFECAIAVYSLRNHSWSVKHNSLKVPRWCYEELKCQKGTAFVQGVVYWRPTYYRRHNDSIELFSFDFDNEEFRYLKLPEMEEDMYRFIFELGGSLAVLGISSVRSCIWVMEKKGEIELWRHYWQGDTNSDVFNFFADFTYNEFELLFDEDIGRFFIQSNRKLMAYNIGSNQAQWWAKYVRLRYAETYVESLVLHKGYEGVALTFHE